MNKDRALLLKEYITGNIAPILMENKYLDLIPEYAVVDASAPLEEFNGYYNDKGEFLPPKWFDEANDKIILVIKDIDKINIEDQRKIIEILKYKKVSNFELNKNIIIIVTCDNMNFDLINNDIISLTIQII